MAGKMKSPAKAGMSIKHAIVDQANTQMLIAVSVAVFVVVFCAFAVRSLISQSLYHQRVITEKRLALTTLEASRAEADALEEVYKSFATESVNVLGGDPDGDGELDGDNARIVLDALPSEYDYPALSSSIEKILEDGGYQIQSIGGSEDTSLSSAGATSGEPEPVEIPYPLSVQTSPDDSVRLLQILESSIRPFYVDALRISGGGDTLGLNIDMKTFYQPGTSLQITTKEVR